MACSKLKHRALVKWETCFSACGAAGTIFQKSSLWVMSIFVICSKLKNELTWVAAGCGTAGTISQKLFLLDTVNSWVCSKFESKIACSKFKYNTWVKWEIWVAAACGAASVRRLLQKSAFFHSLFLSSSLSYLSFFLPSFLRSIDILYTGSMQQITTHRNTFYLQFLYIVNWTATEYTSRLHAVRPFQLFQSQHYSPCM